MTIFDKFREWLLQPLMGDRFVSRRKDIALKREYRRGVQRPPLKTGEDNVIINFVGLIVERSVSMLFGKDIRFDLPGESDSAEQDYIDLVWQVNRKQYLLKELALYGAESGTCYVKLLPDGAFDKSGKPVPRLIALDPAMVTMETDPHDHSLVTKYVIAYTVVDKVTEREVVYKQEIEQGLNQEGEVLTGWTIRDYHATDSGRWIFDDEKRWEWDFPPIVYWQNQIETGSAYGRADITDDIIDLQDKLNFVVSNTAKIIKYHAHPKTWGRKFGKANGVAWGVDEMVISDNENAMLQNLEMQSDLGSSLNFIKFIRQGLFDIARSVDIDSLADKLGALTNFALKVLYQDAIGKLEDKRGLYGEGLVEINHRLLELAGMENDGGDVLWPDVLPANELEQVNALKADLDLGLVSKQTASHERGYDWTKEEERLAQESLAGDNVGAALLRAFGQGK